MKKLSTAVLCAIELAVGILLFADPVMFTKGIIIALGAVLIIVGIVLAINYFRTEANEASMKQTLTKGIIAIILGVFCILRRDWFIDVFPVLTVLYGVVVLISGVIKLQWTVDAARLGRSKWYWLAVASGLTIVFALIILFNPFKTTTVMWKFIAITLIIQAVLDAAAAILNRIRTDRNISVDPNVYDGTVIDDNDK